MLTQLSEDVVENNPLISYSAGCGYFLLKIGDVNHGQRKKRYHVLCLVDCREDYFKIFEDK